MPIELWNDVCGQYNCRAEIEAEAVQIPECGMVWIGLSFENLDSSESMTDGRACRLATMTTTWTRSKHDR